MIKNILFAISIALCTVTIFFGFKTKSKLDERISKTGELIMSNDTVTKNLNDKTADIKVARVDKKTAVDGRNETSASFDNESSKENGLRRSLSEVDSEIEGYDAELTDIEARIEEAKTIIRNLVPDAGPNLDIDDVVAHIENLQEDRKLKEAELEEKTVQSEGLAEQVSKGTGQKENYQDRLSTVRQRISRNSVVATVTEVENDYGFVVINRGSNSSNITADSKLLVRRGSRLIGKLTVSSVDPNRAICDIVPDSLKPGQRIQAGDRAVLETPLSN
jgi:phage shock protein A